MRRSYMDVLRNNFLQVSNFKHDRAPCITFGFHQLIKESTTCLNAFTASQRYMFHFCRFFFFFYDLCCIQVSVKRFTLQSNSGVRVQSWTCTQPHVHPGPAPLGFLHIKESPVGYFHTVTKLPTATNSHTNKYAPKWHHIGTFKYQNDQKILF